MPEGPSIVILKEQVNDFIGKKVLEVAGNSKLDIGRIKGQKVESFRSFGKQFLICFKDFSIRVHFLLFGTYRINERKETPSRLSLIFRNGEINFYGCSVKFIESPLDEIYEWRTDVMSDMWDPDAALGKLRLKSTTLVCDALLDQEIFAGVGNIIKNEVLYRIRVHPESRLEKMPKAKLISLIDEAHNYSFDFLNWKKNYVLKKNWLAHTKKVCERCNLPMIKSYLGKTNRRTFYCENCQHKYV